MKKRKTTKTKALPLSWALIYHLFEEPQRTLHSLISEWLLLSWACSLKVTGANTAHTDRHAQPDSYTTRHTWKLPPQRLGWATSNPHRLDAGATAHAWESEKEKKTTGPSLPSHFFFFRVRLVCLGTAPPRSLLSLYADFCFLFFFLCRLLSVCRRVRRGSPSALCGFPRAVSRRWGQTGWRSERQQQGACAITGALADPTYHLHPTSTALH